jgi:hypothetical protein
MTARDNSNVVYKEGYPKITKTVHRSRGGYDINVTWVHTGEKTIKEFISDYAEQIIKKINDKI